MPDSTTNGRFRTRYRRFRQEVIGYVVSKVVRLRCHAYVTPETVL